MLELITEKYPTSLALVRTRISGFSALKTEDQLRAAAFALKRDLGVDAATIRLTARAIGATDDVSIAFATIHHSQANNAASPTCPARFFEAMQSGEIHWFGAPNGIAIGPSGSAVIESPAHALTEKNSHELPNEMVTLLSARGAPHHVILHDATQTPSPETLALWAAATGATFTVDSENTVTSGNSIALSAVSPTTITQPRHAIDRALLVACVASLACVGVAAIQWFSDHALLKNATDSSATSTVGTISGVSANTARGTLAGDLIARIATVSPELMRSMKSATYGGGAWIMSFNPPTVATAATPATATSPSSAAAATADANTLINLAANALRNNGFSVQVTTQPEPRLRVQAP